MSDHDSGTGVDRAALFEAQNRVLEASARGDDLADILRTLCIEVEKLLGRGARCSVLLYVDGRLRHGAAPNLSGAYIDAIDGVEAGPSVGSCGTAAYLGEPVIVDDISTDSRWVGYREVAAEAGLVACWSTPVFDADQHVIATFAVYPETRSAPCDTDREVIDSFSNIAGLVIDQAQTRSELAAERRRLALVVAGTRAGAWEWNPRDDTAVVTDAWANVLGYDREEIAPVSFETMKAMAHPDDIERVQRKLEEHFRGETDFFEAEFRMRHKDGHWVWLLDRGQVFERDEDGIPIQVSGLHIDITHRRKAEEQLAHMQRLESLGRLAGGIAHDFNNILMGFFASVSFARDQLDDEHVAQQELEEAERSLDRAKRLTGQLLTFAKGGAPVKEPVGLGDVIERVVRFDLAGSSIRPNFDFAPDVWRAEVDLGQIQQVFSNLAINALESIDGPGHLSIALENAIVRPDSDLPLPTGRYVRVTVRDTGDGIDEAVRDRIFDPYFSSKEDGRGLGLATVFSIVNQHGGHIRVTSEPGDGAEFELHLPADASAGVQEDEEPSTDEFDEDSTATGPLRVLVVDDEESVRRVCRRILEREGHEVECVPDGVAALDVYEEAMKADRRFDVVIMDLTIPGGMGGKEAVKKLLEIDPAARAIASTGYADDPVMANFDDYGFVGIAPKPYPPGELADLVARSS